MLRKAADGPTETGSPASLVIVEDEAPIRDLLGRVVGTLPDVRVSAFADPEEALAWCRSHTPDVILTDHRMPGLPGAALITLLRREPHLADVPIMMVTGLADDSLRLDALEQGANDVLTRPIEPTEMCLRVKNMLAIRRGRHRRRGVVSPEPDAGAGSISARERETILRLSRAAEYRDWDSPAHLDRVSAYARLIAQRMGLPPAECELVYQAVPMHDVGKIGIPDRILLKTGPLAADEFEVVKRHTVVGHEVLSGSGSELLQTAAIIALTHHERFDGSGYPRGFSGTAIPLHARIMAVADTFDVLTSNRPYKDAWPVPLAWAWLINQAGTHFDPACVTAFQEGESDVRVIRAGHTD